MSEWLPCSSLPAISEKLRAHRDREEKVSVRAAIEAEKCARFGIPRRRPQAISTTDLLLGDEFYEGSGACSTAGLDLQDADGVKKTTERMSKTVDVARFSSSLDHEELPAILEMPHRGVDGGDRMNLENPFGNLYSAKDWITRPLPQSIASKVDSVRCITAIVQTANYGAQKVILGFGVVDMLRGRTTSECTEEPEMYWVEDHVIDAFTGLINRRSEAFLETLESVHKPSRILDPFRRRRVRTYIFNSQFFTIWKRPKNGGYDSVRNWRRKVPHFNSVGMFMFPAFIHNNHWALAIVDVDGEQFLYYDPKGAKDTCGVISVAKEWLTEEIMSAAYGDVFQGMDISSWPTAENPPSLPRQLDAHSCGVFVLYVAERYERGVKPVFTQSDIPVMRSRTILIIRENKLYDDEDPEWTDVPDPEKSD